MGKKKETKVKKTSSTVQNDFDINDVNAMFEDMKNLVLQKTEEKAETQESTKSECHENSVETESVNENAEEQHIINEDENLNQNLLESVEEESNEDSENTEDLSFIEELKEDNEEEKIEMLEEEVPIQEKPKRMSYQDMFGATWRGYGYDEI